MISFHCSVCGQKLQVKDELAGKRGKCPHCKEPVAVPSTPAPSVAARSEIDPDARTLPPEPGPTTGEADVATGASDASQVRTIPPGAVPAGASREHYDFLSLPQQPDELGRLGPYRVLKVLGAGGMGVVFQAEDPSLDRKVALKAMLPSLAASESARVRFLREAKTAAAIEHDHIVPIFQVGQDRGVPFIAMPFLKGMPLDERLRREPIPPLAETLRIGRETAKGLAAAHEAGLIHRDIKPANLWLEGAEGRVKILDFGLARAAVDNAQLTQSGAILGTPAYMAPEQASGKPVDARCDLFALGCVLYRLCTGEMPFAGPDAISTLLAVATEQPASPVEVNPAIPPALADLVMRLLAKKPADRPASAVDVIRELQAIEAGRSEKDQPDTELAIRPIRRRPAARAGRRWFLAALAAGLLALAVVGAVIVIQIQGGEGSVTIETVDPDVEVVISGNGRSFTIKDKKTKQEVTLPVGKYEVELKGGKDGLKLETPSFTLKRGKQVVVRVTWQEGKPPPRERPPAEAVFKPLFNGKDLTGWQSVVTMKERQTLTKGQIARKLETDNKKNLPHWTVKDGVLAYDGKGDTLQTVKDYGDFELLCEWKIAEQGDSGIFLRGQPQVQIWDSDRCPGAKGKDRHSGSGGLWNNPEDKGKRPLKKTDKPVGEWNRFRIIVKDDLVTVYLNGELVVEKQPLLNYWFRDQPVPKRGPIELQHHSGPLWFRNILIKELSPGVVYEGGAGPGKGKHVVLIAAEAEYRSEEAMPQLGKILAKRHGFKCTVLFPIDPNDGTINPNLTDNIPGLEALQTADLMVLFTRFCDLPDEQMKHIVDYVEAGKPIVGIRTATHAFNLRRKDKYAKWSHNADKEWPGGFGKQVLGETWINHHGKHGSESTRGIIAKDASDHPILKGIKDGDIWGPTDVYTVGLPLPGDSTPLVYGQVLAGMKPTDMPVAWKNDPMMPIAWTKTWSPDGKKKGRVFTSTMGSSQDMQSEGFRRLLVNAVYWAVGLESRIPALSDVDLVGEFKPTPFKFGGGARGLKPEVHALR